MPLGRFGGERPPIVPQHGQAGALRAPGQFGAGPMQPEPVIRSMKKGGKVKKTGRYKLHKGERVVPAKKARKKSDSHAYVAGRPA
jgi:hypothetical protein